MLRIMEFKTVYRSNKEPYDEVLVAPIGDADRTQTWLRIPKIIPDTNADETTKNSMSYNFMVARWNVIKPAYDAWKQGNEIPETGTPLAAWPGITAEQAKILRSIDVRTVEEVRDMADGQMSRARIPDIKRLKTLAGEFLDGADAAQKDAKIADLEAKMEAMAEMLAEKLAEAAPEEKPKRGRPRKVEEAAE